MDYNQTGNYTAVAGVVVLVASKVLNIDVTVDTVLAVIGGVIAFVGIVKQFRAHKNLAISTGAYYKRR